jgi:hypothetical protein
METLCLHPNLFIDANGGRSLSKPVIGPFDQLRADIVVIEKDPSFAEERWETWRAGEVLLKLLMSAISDVNQAIGNTDDFVTVGLSFDQGNEINIAVGGDGAANAGPYQDYTDKIPSATTTDMTHGDCDKLFKSRLIYRVRLFRRVWNRQEFRLQFL